MMQEDVLYQVALTLVPNIGPVHAKALLQQYACAKDIFKARLQHLEKIEGIGTIRAKSIQSFKDFRSAEEELKFISKYQITPLFIKSDAYPKRLLHCYDPPTLLYYRGNADLNTARIVSIIGTRSNTPYGKQVTEQLIRDLAAMDVLIISGLAFGIDAIAHKAALQYKLPTVGVLAHGLDLMYPPQHAPLAKQMTTQGGLLTEFPSNTKPDKHHFPARNRIVAGLADATIVIESGTTGGSIITADLANCYNKDVFAFPGKTIDVKSSGCNQLIKNNKAILLTSAQDLIQLMGWDDHTQIPPKKQIELFVDLTEDEKKIVDLLRNRSPLHIDEINRHSGLSNSMVAVAVLQLELKQVIETQPGKMFRLLL